MSLVGITKPGKRLHWLAGFGFSTLVHAALIFGMLELYNGLGADAGNETQIPEITVTSLVLDPITLQNISEESTPPTEAYPDEETPEESTPEAEPDLVPEPEPEAPEEVVPEPVEPEVIEPEEIEPEVIEPEVIEPETVERLTPAPVEVERIAPQTLSPIAGSAQTVERIKPLAPQSGTRLRALGPDGAAPERISAIQNQAMPERVIAQQTVLPRSNPVPTPAPPNPEGAPGTDPSAGKAISEMIARIRGLVGEPCLIALPQSRNGGIELVLLASQESAIQSFATQAFADVATPPAQRPLLVDGRQCAAIDFIRTRDRYPAFRLSINVTAEKIASGGYLSGTVGNAAGRFLTLLLIDDNGVVQDLGEFVSFGAGKARFDVPVTRNGAPRDTSQLLLAVATSGRPASVAEKTGQLAEDFFPALEKDLRGGASYAMVPFDVR
ncbi:MAG: hypothetical protein ACRBBK_05670 [Paracoccaceae bacterium]